MTSPRSPVGFLMIVLIALLSSDHGETTTNAAVPFPPAAPNSQNIHAICANGHCRLRYPESVFRMLGASYFRRRGKAINRLESWYSVCCGKPEEQKLCCAEQAWKRALSLFCVEEFSIKTIVFECCEDKEDKRWECFNTEVPNKDYTCLEGYTAPTLLSEPGFTFNQTECSI